MMRTDLDHLPSRKQRELGRVVEILHEEFEDALKLSTATWKKRGRILHIILFGSYTRPQFGTGPEPSRGWVDEQHIARGYMSDYDILIIVSHKGLTDVPEYWYKAEDRLIRDSSIQPVVNFIVHSIDEVNGALARSEYFFTDIIKDGIALYSLKGAKTFVTPGPLSPQNAYDMAQEYYEEWLPSAGHFLHHGQDAIEREWNKDAAFQLHQAVERTYICLLLVLTHYNPNSHNIKFLRSQCERLDSRLIDAWPRDRKRYTTMFELLKRAYVEARYSKHYSITTEQLDWLAERTKVLQDIAETICQERLAVLKKAAE